MRKVYRCISPILYAYLIAIIMQVVCAIGIMAFTFMNAKGDASIFAETAVENVYKSTMLITLISQVMTLPILLLIRDSDRKELPIWNEWKHAKETKPSMIFLLIVNLISISFLLNNLISITNLMEIFPAYEEVANTIYASSFLVQFMVTVVFAPLVEEVLFRGLIYKRIRYYANIPTGIILSSLLFGLYHGNMVQAIYATVIGLCLAYVYEKQKSLVWPILLHACINLVSIVVSIPQVSETIYFNDTAVYGILLLSTTIAFTSGMGILLGRPVES